MRFNPEVDVLLARKMHPCMDEIQELREILTHPSLGLEETIKWGSPAYVYQTTFVVISLRSRNFVSLEFPRGSLLKSFEGVLKGNGKLLRTMSIDSPTALKLCRTLLPFLAEQWISMRLSGEINF